MRKRSASETELREEIARLRRRVAELEAQASAETGLAPSVPVRRSNGAHAVSPTAGRRGAGAGCESGSSPAEDLLLEHRPARRPVGEVTPDSPAILRDLRASEQRLRTILMSMPVMFDAFDADGTIVFWNDECERVTGYSAQEIVGNPQAMELLYPDDGYRRSMYDEWQKRGSEYHNWEWRLTSKDGTPRTIAWSNISRLVQIPGWESWGIGIDVTERVRAYSELEQSERRWQDLVESLDAIVWEARLPDLRFTYISGQVEQTLGYPVEQWMTEPDFWVGRLHPDDREAALRHCLECAERGLDHRFEYRAIAKDGEVVWFDDSVTVVNDESGRTVMLRGVMVDVTNRKRAEQELQLRKSLLEAQLEADSDGILTVSADRRLLAHNRRFTEIWGIPADILRDEDCIELCRWAERFVADAPAFRERIEQLYHHPDEIGDDEIVLKDGRILERYTAPVKSQQGACLGRIWFYRDVTGRVRTQEKLRRLEGDLLHMTRLGMMGEMAAGLVHELGQPLFAIANFAKAACREIERADFDNQRTMLEWTQRIDNVASSAVGILDRLRTFARRSPGEWTRFAIGEAVAESIELVRFDARRQDTAIEFRPPEPDVQVQADRVAVQQVIVNLLKNALEAVAVAGKLEKRIELGVRRLKDGVEVRVADSGPGVAPAIENTLFEPFLTTKPNGMGMGLAISRTIVENHGGRMWFDRRTGGGAEFHFTIPLHQESPAE